MKIFVIIGLVFLGFAAPNIYAQENFKPYGSIAQEDQIYTEYDGYYWVNTGAHLGIGNGQFMKITDLDSDYSIDQAIERFGIREDTTSFVVQPSLYSNTVFMFELDEDLQFQITHIYEDNESGFYQFVMENQ